MSLLLSIVTVSAFDHERLKLSLGTSRLIPSRAEHIFIIPENDLVSRLLLQNAVDQGIQLKFSFDNNSGVYSAMNLGATVASGQYVIFWNSGDLINLSSELEIFMNELSVSRPTWAVAQGVLESGDVHKNTLSSIGDFRNQKLGSYVSHQVIACERRTMFDLGLFDLRYKVAADTKMIQDLARLTTPLVSSTRIVLIEEPRYASKFHRKSRRETAKLAIHDLFLRAYFKPILNVLKREILFLKTR